LKRQVSATGRSAHRGMRKVRQGGWRDWRNGEITRVA